MVEHEGHLSNFSIEKFIVSESHSWTIQKYVLPYEFPSVQKHVLKGVRLKCTQFLFKAVATHALFLLALANRHPQSCSATEVEGGCTCSQVSLISAACCKTFNSMNILQYCPSDFYCKTYLWLHACNILVSQSMEHQKKCLTSKLKMSHMQPRLAMLFLF